MLVKVTEPYPGKSQHSVMILRLGQCGTAGQVMRGQTRSWAADSGGTGPLSLLVMLGDMCCVVRNIFIVRG